MTSGVGRLGFAEALPALSRTAAANGSSIDLASEVTGQFNFLTGAGPGGPTLMGILTVGTAGTAMSVKFQYSADGSTGWTDITGGAFTDVTTSATREVIRFVAPDRYIRCISHTQTGTYVFGVIVVGVERFA